MANVKMPIGLFARELGEACARGDGYIMGGTGSAKMEGGHLVVPIGQMTDQNRSALSIYGDLSGGMDN